MTEIRRERPGVLKNGNNLERIRRFPQRIPVLLRPLKQEHTGGAGVFQVVICYLRMILMACMPAYLSIGRTLSSQRTMVDASGTSRSK